MKLSPESEYDNHEYKLHINNLDKNKIEHYITQLNYRLYIGNGICFYYLGVTDWGDCVGMSYDNVLKSYNNLTIIVNLLNKKLNTDARIIAFKLLHIDNLKNYTSYTLKIKIKSLDDKYDNSNILTIC